MVTKYINHNTSANKKGKRTLKRAGSTDVGRTGHHEDYGCFNLFWSFTKYMDTIIPMPIKKLKGKRTLKRIFYQEVQKTVVALV